MKIGKFIALVKERPILYDSLHPLNKDRKQKEQMWREISSSMNIHIDIAKSRWKSLKDCYTKYLKSKMAAGPAVYVKYINWQWAEHMEFMKPHIKFGLILTNIELQDTPETDDLVTKSKSDIQGYQSSSEVLGIHERCETPERSGTPETSITYEKSDTNNVCEKSERRKRSKTQERTRKLERTFEKIRRRRRAIISPDDNTSPNTDRVFELQNKKIESYSATELIFLGYAKTIKTFSIRRRAQVKMKIAKIMMEEEIAHFEETMSHSEYQSHL